MQAGDHLVSQRVGYIHHGLYIGGGDVIHYAGLSDWMDFNDAEVQQVSLAEFEGGHGSSIESHPAPRFSPQQSVQRAQSRLGENSYNVAINNCEHFVNYCIEGEHRSKQVEAVIGTIKTAEHLAQTEAGKQVIDKAVKVGSKVLGKKAGEQTAKKAMKGLGSKVAPALAAGEAVVETAQIWQDPNKGVAEKVYDTATAGYSAAGSVAGGAKGASVGAAIGTALGPLGTAVGGFIGGVIGSIAGSSIVRGIAKGIKGFFKGLFGGRDEDAELEQLQQRMQQLAAYSPSMGEELEQGYQDFLRRGEREQYKLRSPYEQDYAKLQQYCQLTPEQYAQQFAQISQELGHYAPQITQQVQQQLQQAEQLPDEQRQEELRKLANYHVSIIAEAIQTQLQQAEQQFIYKFKADYLGQLEQKINEYEQARATLEILFGRAFGKLYDRSQGMLNRAGFELLEHYRKLAEDPAIQELIDELGRMRQAEKEYEKALIETTELRPMRRTVPYFREEMVGVTIGGELAHVLPSEYSLLNSELSEASWETEWQEELRENDDSADELLEWLFYKKLSERQLNIYEFTSIETDYASHRSQMEIEQEKANENKGPFVLCVDTSGSMAGTPERVAKTLAFIILRTALEENRKCLLMNFGDTIQTLELTELSQSLPRLMDFLQMSFHAGNSVDPVEASLPLLEKPGFAKADIVVVSDFQLGNHSQATINKMRQAQETGTKFHSVVIGHGTDKNKLFDSEWVYNGSWSGFHSTFNKTRG